MKQILTIVILCCFPFTAWAVKMSTLYQAEVSVASQTYDLREQAVKDGLLQVLIKISGNLEIDKNPIIRAGLKKANYYVQEYHYSADSTAASQYQLEINYEPTDVKRLLQNANVAYWGESRPLTLIWLTVMDKQHELNVISNETQNVIFDKMVLEGKKYGLPLIFPMMDVDDLNQISSDDITSMKIPVLKEAAKRYAPDVLLIGEIEENDSSCRSYWKLLMNDSQWDWKVENKTTDEAITLVMSRVSRVISGQH